MATYEPEGTPGAPDHRATDAVPQPRRPLADLSRLLLPDGCALRERAMPAMNDPDPRTGWVDGERVDRPSAAPDCPSGKYGYPSETAAKNHTARMARKHNARRLSVYECHQCHTWHTTNPKARDIEDRRGLAPRPPMPAEEAFAELERMNRERTGQ